MGSGYEPVRRFSIALAAVLALTALTVSVFTAVLIGRYVEQETEQQTAHAVASHFGTIFGEDVIAGTLSAAAVEKLKPVVAFHFGIYDIVATRFYSPDGTVVFSYSPYDVGDRPQDPRIAATLAGTTFSARETILTDGQKVIPSPEAYTEPTLTRTAAPAMAGMPGMGSDMHAYPASAMSPKREVTALESWIPVSFPDGVRGAVVVWRDMARVDAAVRTMQLSIAAIVAFAAILLWVILRDVYVRSSQEIRQRSRQLAGALAETERAYDATLGALSNALDVRDTETEGHARRVVQYLGLIADEMKVDPAVRAILQRGALLHDIGKIGVPDDILRKAGPLSPTEWATMRRHPSYGARIVAGIPYLTSVAEIVKHHHERWDGTGYPDGLKAEEIPLGARLFTIADAFDAMTADRPYRKAMDPRAARMEIARHRGTQFDPQVVDAFVRIPLERLGAVVPRVPDNVVALEGAVA